MKLTRNQITDALFDVNCVHLDPEHNQWARENVRALVDFNFAVLGNPEVLTADEWNNVNSPLPEHCTVH